MCTLGCERFNLRSRRLTVVSAKERTHIDQASDAAAPRLIPPIPRLCCLDPSVTTPLYSTTVSQALRQPLRGKGLNDIDPHQLPTRTWRSRGCGVRDTSLS